MLLYKKGVWFKSDEINEWIYEILQELRNNNPVLGFCDLLYLDLERDKGFWISIKDL